VKPQTAGLLSWRGRVLATWGRAVSASRFLVPRKIVLLAEAQNHRYAYSNRCIHCRGISCCEGRLSVDCLTELLIMSLSHKPS
jgi:nitrite reductase/ring-hydroxylating ferredoxin subunit